MGDTTLVGHCVSQGGYGDNGTEVVFARGIMAIQQPLDKLVLLSTNMVDSSSVYKHANISFSTNSYGMFSVGSDSGHCSIWDILRHRCSAVVNETKEWADLFNYDYSGQTIWSGHIGTNPSIDASITCDQCYTKLTPELIFNLQITNNKLANVEVIIQGNLEAVVSATATATGAFSKSDSINVYTIDVPDVVFYVGIFPIHIKFSVPITASYAVSVTGAAHASTGVHLSGFMGAGFGYDSASGFGPRFSDGYSYGIITPTGSANANAQVKVSLVPSLRLDVDLVLSGQADVAPYFEFDAEAQTAQTLGVEGQLYGGIDVDVQGSLGVTFHGHNIGPHLSFGPKDVFSYRKELWSGQYPPQQTYQVVTA